MMLVLRHTLLIISLSFVEIAFADVVNLASLKWNLINSNGTINVSSTGPPNQAHIDLLNAGLITEPLLGINGTLVSLIFPHLGDDITHRFYPTLDR